MKAARTSRQLQLSFLPVEYRGFLLVSPIISCSTNFIGTNFWLYVGFVGDAATANEILNPPTNEDSHPDDPRCSEPSINCHVCQGVRNVCTTGTDSGCACNDQEDAEECPTGDKQPQCSNEKYAPNKENKCTQDHAGCDCKTEKEEEECPKDEFTLDCEDCGGPENLTKKAFVKG